MRAVEVALQLGAVLTRGLPLGNYTAGYRADGSCITSASQKIAIAGF